MFELSASNTKIDQLGPCGIQLGFRLRHIRARRHAAVEPVPGESEILLIRFNSALEQVLFGVRAVQLKVVLRQLRLKKQSSVLQLGGGRLGSLGACPDAAANTSPNIGLV